MNVPPPRPADPRLMGHRPVDTGPATSGPPQRRRTEPGPAECRHVEPAAAVARAMTGLDGLETRPLAEHVAVFEQVHAALSDALAAGSPAAG